MISGSKSGASKEVKVAVEIFLVSCLVLGVSNFFGFNVENV